jgi:hypothetical protein
VAERTALALLRERQRALLARVKNKGKKAVEVELHVAESKKALDLFRRYTGRKIKPDTLRRLLQGKRSQRRSHPGA